MVSGETGGIAEGRYKRSWVGRNDGEHSSLVVTISQNRKQRRKRQDWTRRMELRRSFPEEWRVG